MSTALQQETVRRRAPGMLLAVLAFVTLASLGVGVAFNRPFARVSLFTLTNLVGPTVEGLYQGKGLTVCTTTMGTVGNPICFHAARMPVPSLVVASGVWLFGDRFLPVAFFKLVLFLLPMIFSIVLVWERLPASRWQQVAIALLLAAPFGMTPFLADVVNLQVEEGYAYSLLALAVAMLFFGPGAAFRSLGFAGTRESQSRVPLGFMLLFAFAVDGLYLTKSAMAPAVAVLTLAYLPRLKHRSRRALLLLLVAAAPVGWSLHQHHASGRYSLGTSIDGINLHKANVATFLEHYPPRAGTSLDQYDTALNAGHTFPDEWSFNDYHQRTALTFLRSHPRATLQGDLRKLDVLFVTVQRYGSSESHGLQLKLEVVSLALFRVILWTAIACSVYGLWRWRFVLWRGAGATFLALLGACALPYLLGFAYTRHASVLIYPACLMCCRVLCDDQRVAGDGPV